MTWDSGRRWLQSAINFDHVGRMMIRFRPTTVKFLTSSALLAASTMLHAQTTIDDFSVAQGPLSHTGSIMVLSDFQAGAGILGGERTMRLTLADASGTASMEVAGGVWTCTTDANADFELWWDGTQGDTSFNPNGGLGGIDLTAGGKDAFEFEVISNNVADDFRIQIWTSGAEVSNAIFTLPTTPGVVSVPFADFTGTADFTDVEAVFFRTVNRPGAWSYSISFLETTPVTLQSFDIE